MKKYLGQNFLVNSYVVDYIISHMCIKTNDFIFEIYPNGKSPDEIISLVREQIEKLKDEIP